MPNNAEDEGDLVGTESEDADSDMGPMVSGRMQSGSLSLANGKMVRTSISKTAPAGTAHASPKIDKNGTIHFMYLLSSMDPCCMAWT